MKRVVSVMLLSMLIAVTGFTQTDLQPAAIVRLTKTEPITVKQFKTELERVEKQAGRSFNTDEQRQLLNAMIDEKLALQAAERDRIVVAENEITQQIQQIRNDMAQQQGRQPTDAEFAAVVKEQTGLDIPVFREQIRKQLITQKYLLSKKESLLKSIKIPTEAEILEAYALTKSQFVRPQTVRFSTIMVPFGPDAASKARAKEIADRLFRDIGSDPAKFDEAVVKGQAGNVDYQAGDRGYLPRIPEAQRLVGPELMNIAFERLKQGEVSKVIEGPRGYEIIKITETYEQKSLGLDDIFQIGTRMTVRDYIGNMLLQSQQQRVLKQATDELVAELRRGNPFQIMEKNLGW